ncbi:MAG: hypothetical protein RLZZ77_52 [Bacteroidota bacterium]|jgi:hypothetical protein
MIKYAALAINFISIFFLQLFSGADIMVENSMPNVLYKGEKKQVEITIDKADIQGFAKLEIVLPTGLIASAGETNGASFTFTQQKARFVWMSLPAQSNFKVTYFIESMDGVSGKMDVKGAFSYIADNKRVDYGIPVKSISVLNEDAPKATTDVATATTPVDTAVDPVAENKKPTPSSPTQSQSQSPTQTQSQSQSESPTQSPSTTVAVEHNTETMILDASRTITPISDKDFRVDIRVESKGLTGFAKVVENVPAEYSIFKIQDAGATVTQDKGIIKFVWFEIPNADFIDITYKISSPNVASGIPNITGELSYVEHNNPKKKPILTIGGGATATEVIAENKSTEPTNTGNTTTPKETSTSANNANNNGTNATETKVTKEEKTANTTAAPKEATAQNTSKESTKAPKTTANEVTKVPSAEKGITYKVQIMAAHRVVNKTYFNSYYNFSEGFNIENHEGWVKYTTGQFAEYKNARDERERIKGDYANLPGPFVTAYNDGARITVQEALLITKQQWYQ